MISVRSFHAAFLRAWRGVAEGVHNQPAPSVDLYKKFFDLYNIVMAAAIAVAVSNTTDLFASASRQGALFGVALFILALQIFMGIVTWMLIARYILLFQSTAAARTDLYMMLMAIPLIFIVLFYAAQKISPFDFRASNVNVLEAILGTLQPISYILLACAFVSTGLIAYLLIRQTKDHSTQHELGNAAYACAVLTGTFLGIGALLALVLRHSVR